MSSNGQDERAQIDQRIAQLLDEAPPSSTDDQEFWGRQFDLGLAWIQFPEGKGGMGMSPRHQKHIDKKLIDAGANFRNKQFNLIGIGMGGGTLIAHGTPEQQDRWLRPMWTMEEFWCQLFSEPGAGSDLAGLATSAVKDGGEWIVNGQKVWTTIAHISKWGMLVTRTDPDVAKHAGLTYFMVDMESDGVDVRPLYQITGEAEFNEVYFDDVHIPDENRIGEVGQGWSVAMATLMNERVAIGGGTPPRASGAISHAVKAFQEHAADDEAARDELARLWIEAESLRLTAMRASENAKKGTPGPEGSTAKLNWADLNKEISSFTMELMGPEGMLLPGGYEFSRPELTANRTASPHKLFLRARANSIEGGTSEIMRNILGERVLGLPGEPRVDKNVAWKDVPR